MKLKNMIMAFMLVAVAARAADPGDKNSPIQGLKPQLASLVSDIASEEKAAPGDSQEIKDVRAELADARKSWQNDVKSAMASEAAMNKVRAKLKARLAGSVGDNRNKAARLADVQKLGGFLACIANAQKAAAGDPPSVASLKAALGDARSALAEANRAFANDLDSDLAESNGQYKADDAARSRALEAQKRAADKLSAEQEKQRADGSLIKSCLRIVE